MLGHFFISLRVRLSCLCTEDLPLSGGESNYSHARTEVLQEKFHWSCIIFANNDQMVDIQSYKFEDTRYQ